MAVPWHKNLSPKPAKEYIWTSSTEYYPGDVAWYDGVFYIYIGDKYGETTGKPTLDTFTNTYQEVGGTGSDTHTERSWLMIDPRIYDRDPLYQSSSATFSGAATVSANLRGFPTLSVSQIYPLKSSGSAYEGTILKHTGEFSDAAASWGSLYDGASMSNAWGQADAIGTSGTRTVKNKYVIMSGKTPFSTYNVVADVIYPSGLLYTFEKGTNEIEDNQGVLDARRYGTADGPTVTITESTTPNSKFTGTVNFSNIGMSHPTIGSSAINATMTQAMFGASIAYRCIVEYYELETVTVPGAYTDLPDRTFYLRKGGTLTLVSGSGVPGSGSPRVYTWSGPYNELVQEQVQSSTFTLKDTYDGYTGYTAATFNQVYTDALITYVDKLVLYSTIDPEPTS